MHQGDVIQFNENHKWCGTLGIITDIKDCGKNGMRYTIGVPIPQQGTAFIFSMAQDMEVEYIGKAILTLKEEDDNDRDQEK